ncbi:hypothetical protein [Deinococcus metallilatus]|uniref:Uncharacterized protein n=1 Tax=Deinococcus metallilatus TaxID=1211322 RepID=A0AAJ5F5K6_9DEIO|nr:hypothetical protein [Deinococcus metallilatus]RXJ14898.1 hypothetical protein ERJ73_04215 [Deinococcus metallilatus]TLK31019.1 hypothetical protein FCS05_04530 [Deinococcus metallilatus]GMA17943.1 hypothetical protein GCM10025871_42740 [Deinococcus metallilatus]
MRCAAPGKAGAGTLHGRGPLDTDGGRPHRPGGQRAGGVPQQVRDHPHRRTPFGRTGHRDARGRVRQQAGEGAQHVERHGFARRVGTPGKPVVLADPDAELRGVGEVQDREVRRLGGTQEQGGQQGPEREVVGHGSS